MQILSIGMDLKADLNPLGGLVSKFIMPGKDVNCSYMKKKSSGTTAASKNHFKTKGQSDYIQDGPLSVIWITTWPNWTSLKHFLLSNGYIRRFSMLVLVCEVTIEGKKWKDKSMNHNTISSECISMTTLNRYRKCQNIS